MIAEILGGLSALCMFGSIVFAMLGLFSLFNGDNDSSSSSSSSSSSPEPNPVTPKVVKAEEEEKKDLKKEEKDIHKLYTSELRTLAAIRLEQRASEKMWTAYDLLHKLILGIQGKKNVTKREAKVLSQYVNALNKYARQLGQWKRQGANLVRIEQRDERRMITAYNRVLHDVHKTDHDTKTMKELVTLWDAKFNSMERDHRLQGNKSSHDYNQVGGAIKHHHAEMEARVKELKDSLGAIDKDLKNRINVTLAQWVSLINARKQMVKEDRKLAEALHKNKIPSIVKGKEHIEKAFAQIAKFVDKKKSLQETNGASTIAAALDETLKVLVVHHSSFKDSRDDWKNFYRQAAAIVHNLHKLEKEVHAERKKVSKTVNNKTGGI